MLQGLKVGVASANMFFRTMRSCGLWVEEPHRSVVLATAKSMCELWFLKLMAVCLSFVHMGYNVVYLCYDLFSQKII